MRQSGVLAGAAIYALDRHVERLAEDHAHARRFAEGIAGVRGVRVDLGNVETNIVYFEVEGDAGALCGRLDAEGVRLLALGSRTVRAVTHLDVDGESIDRAVGAIAAAMG